MDIFALLFDKQSMAHRLYNINTQAHTFIPKKSNLKIQITIKTACMAATPQKAD
jgi:hypothetical protein